MLSRWQSTIVDAKGNIQPSAVLRILNERDQTLALVYQTNNDLQPYPLGYVTANANGFAYFYAAPGRYRIQSIDLDIDWRDVEIGAMATARAALENSGMTVYDTHAGMLADSPAESPVYARVVNDVDPELNGYYIWDGSTWSRTTEQPADADKVLRSDIPQAAPLLSIPQSGVVELPFALDALRTATRNVLYGDGPYPTLDLRFSGATLLDPSVDFTRASTATYTDAMGVVRTAGVNEPRFDYDPATGKPLGVLIEPGATNECRFSEDFSAWDKERSRTESGYSAPDGSNTASKVIADYTGTEGRGVRLTLDYSMFQDGSGRSISGFFKAGTYEHIYLSRTRTGPASQSLTVNLITGEAQTNGLSGVAKATDVGDGWWHVRASFDYTLRQSPVFYLSSYIGSSDTGWTEDDHSPNDGEYIYAWGFQFEKGSYPTSYIPTTDSPATRAADELSYTLGEEFNPDEGTLWITAQVPEGEVVATIGDLEIVSDDDEMKTYVLSYDETISGDALELGKGIFQSIEYFPRVLP